MEEHKYLAVWIKMHLRGTIKPHDILEVKNVFVWAWIAQSVQRLTKGSTVRYRMPVGVIFPHPSRPVLEPNQPPVQRVPGHSWG